MKSVVIGQRNDRMNARKKFIPPIKNVRLKLTTKIMKYTTNPKTVKKFIAILLFFLPVREIQQNIISCSHFSMVISIVGELHHFAILSSFGMSSIPLRKSFSASYLARPFSMKCTICWFTVLVSDSAISLILSRSSAFSLTENVEDAIN